jgi:hypothetical protein
LRRGIYGGVFQEGYMRVELDLAACMQSWPRGCSDEAGEEADGGSNASMHISVCAP